MIQKQISVKVYKPDGKFLKEWVNVNFSGFTKEINAGMGECVLELLEKFDYTGGELLLGNLIDISVSDKQTITSSKTGETGGGWKLIYSGYISMYEPLVDGKEEKIAVHCLGHYTKLSLDILKSGTQTTVYTDATNGINTTGSAAADVGKVLRGIIDRYRAETSNPKISYVNQNIPTVSQNLKYTFEQRTYREAIDIAKNAAPSGYFYYVDEYGTFWFKGKASTPTHKFELKKHFKSIRVERSMEKIRNVILIWNGETGGSKVYKNYQDTVSINQYGRRAAILTDYGIDDETSADNLAAKLLAENKDPDIKVVCEVIDDNYDAVNGYDIETIEPGDTCRFLGFDETFADIFRDNMLITKVNYLVDRVELTIEIVLADIEEQLKKLSDQVSGIDARGIPTIYT